MYIAIIDIVVYSIFKSHTINDFIYFVPVIVFYELMILLLNYTKWNFYIFIVQSIFIPITLLFFKRFEYFEFLIYMNLILFMYRSTFNFFYVIRPDGFKDRLDYFCYSFMYSPFFIHKYKDEIFKSINERNIKVKTS